MQRICVCHICLFKHFRELFEEQTMMKKWLYGVALGTLLVAGNATGITVNEVLSDSFWYGRVSLSRIESYSPPRIKLRKQKETNDEDGRHYSELAVRRAKSPIRWKQKKWYNNFTDNDNNFHVDTIADTTIYGRVRKDIMHTVSEEHNLRCFVPETQKTIITNTTERVDETFESFCKKKDRRPYGPYVVDDWFPDGLIENSWLSARFGGTEHNAVTNVISDNEAYITGTVSQTGHVDEYNGYKVDEDASLLRTYTQHITTDADHVYIEQEITENTQNDPCYNSQNTYQTQYTATFKKGRFKNEKETISKVSQRERAPWVVKYLQQNEKN